MKKIALLLAVAFMFILLASCADGENENIPDVKLREGEMLLSGRVEETYSNTLLLKDENGGRYYISCSDEVTVVEDGKYVSDLPSDSLRGKKISVICSSQIMETYPMQTRDERMIIIE